MKAFEERACVTELDEGDLSEFVVDAPAVWNLVRSELDLSNHRPELEVVTKEIFPGRKKPGDIDIFSVDPARPEAVVGIECKKVKMKQENLDSATFTGLSKTLRRAHGKAKYLLDLGFSRSYVLFLLSIDARSQTDRNFVGRGLTGEMVRALDEVLVPSEFPEGLGVLVLEVVQPVDRPVGLSAGVGLRVRRKATLVSQPFGTTDAVRRYLAKRRN